MTQHVEKIIAELESLQMSDFDFWNDDAHGLKRLDDLIEQLFRTPNPELAMDAMFRVMERLPDADLGAPGSIVHGIEKFQNYEPRLIESIRTLPTQYNIWMVNRILNTLSAGEHRDSLLALLKEASTHQKISEDTKQSVFDFLEHQASRV